MSLTEPTDAELQATAELVQTLRAMGVFESEEESRRRYLFEVIADAILVLITSRMNANSEKVLSRLDKMVKQFVRRVSLARKLPEAVANEAGGKIFTFGSYRLGVHGAGECSGIGILFLMATAHARNAPGADIDTLCVVPKYVQREDFFSDFYEQLQTVPEVIELTAVPDAYVPVIKMCFDGIPIDLVFARLGLSSVPDYLELRDDNLLRNMDERCYRSLNGE